MYEHKVLLVYKYINTCMSEKERKNGNAELNIQVQLPFLFSALSRIAFFRVHVPLFRFCRLFRIQFSLCQNLLFCLGPLHKLQGQKKIKGKIQHFSPGQIERINTFCPPQARTRNRRRRMARQNTGIGEKGLEVAKYNDGRTIVKKHSHLRKLGR